MIESGHLELVGSESRGSRPIEMPPEECNLTSSATKLAHSLAWLPGRRAERPFQNRCQALLQAFKPLLAALSSEPAATDPRDLRFLRENLLLLESELGTACGTFSMGHNLPLVSTPEGAVLPRIAALALDYVDAAGCHFEVATFSEYVLAFQEITVLDMAELWALVPVLKLVLLEEIAG